MQKKDRLAAVFPKSDQVFDQAAAKAAAFSRFLGWRMRKGRA
jgi:hypothetical protein